MAIPQLPKEYDQLDQWTTLMFLYKSALQEVQTRINILSEEFQQDVYKRQVFSFSYGLLSDA